MDGIGNDLAIAARVGGCDGHRRRHEVCDGKTEAEALFRLAVVVGLRVDEAATGRHLYHVCVCGVGGSGR